MRSASDWQRIEELFHAALKRSPAERETWLAGQDPGLRSEVASLLTSLSLHQELSADSPPETGPPEAIAIRFGPYHTVRLLGRGGMGAVYLARRADGQFEQTVALKAMAPHLAGGEFLRRFHTERQLLASLNHPNITRLLDGGVSSSGDPYLVMEYVEGQPLDRHCDERKLDVDSRLRLFISVCEAVDHAHRNLIVHRDLKPSNILVTADGAVKLLDFGTAALMDENRDLTATRSRMITPRYASPEQLRGERANLASDIFSLGVILYELLTGAWPFGNPDSVVSELHRAMQKVAPALPQSSVTEEAALCRALPRERLRRLLAGDLSAIALKALENDPSRRYGSARQLVDDIERFRNGRPVRARQQTTIYRFVKFVRRRWLPVTAAAIFVAGLVGATIVSVNQARTARAEAHKAGTVTRFLADLLEAQNPSGGANVKVTLAEVIDSARQNLSQFDDQPAVQAELHLRLGSAYINMSSWNKGKEEFRKAVESGLRAGDSERVAVAESELGATLTQAGEKAEEAEALCRDAVKRLRALKAPAGLSVYLVLGNQALVIWLLHGHRPEVVSLAQEAISVAKKDASVPRWRVATGEADLAQYFIQEGANAEAESLLKDALEMDNRAGKPGLNTGEISSALGTLRAKAGDFQQAERYQHRYLEEMVRVLGPDSERAGIAGVVWAVSLARVGRNGEALQECGKSLAIVRATVPAGSERLPAELARCAFVLNEAGKPAEAEPVAREALQLLKAGRANRTVEAESATELGVALVKRHRYGEAVPELEKSEQIFLGNRGYGPKHYLTIRAREALAAARIGAGVNK